MITLTTPIPVRNIRKIEATTFDVILGTITIVIHSGGANPSSKAYLFGLSNIAGNSNGLAVDTTPPTWEGTVVVATGVGAVNSKTNAFNAFVTTVGTEEQKLNAILARGIVDGWLDPAFAGT